jgi:hypothetical protein
MVADLVPPDYAWFVCIAARFGKRDTEEAIVEKLLGPEYAARFEDIRGQISRSEFRVVSASRAERLMKDRLFERVFALRHRGFTRGFRNAEVDMHFSVSRELIPVREFLALVARESPQRLTVLLDRGEIA